MYNELQSLKHKINTVEHANDGFKKTNSELQLNLEKARSDLGILESDNNEMHKEIQSLKYKIKSLENTNDEISRKNNEF